MKECPQCDYDAIWVSNISFCVDFEGIQQFYPRKLYGFCNDTMCDQKYWYYPKTGRITKRNVGPESPFLNRKAIARAS